MGIIIIDLIPSSCLNAGISCPSWRHLLIILCASITVQLVKLSLETYMLTLSMSTRKSKTFLCLNNIRPTIQTRSLYYQCCAGWDTVQRLGPYNSTERSITRGTFADSLHQSLGQRQTSAVFMIQQRCLRFARIKRARKHCITVSRVQHYR